MKIRNVIIVAAVFSLLAISLNGISHNGDRSSNPSSEKTLAFVGENTPPGPPAMSEASSTKPSDKAAASTTRSSSPSTPGESGTSASTQTPTPSSTASSTTSLPLQLENSGHAKYMNQTGGSTCTTCHITQANQYTLRQTGWETCGKCHVSSTGNPIPGIEVQHPQLQMLQGVAIGDILPMPSYKYKYLKDSFSCANCHVTNAAKHDFLVPGVTATQVTKGNSSSVSTIDFQQFKGIFKQSSCDVCHPNTAETVNRVKEIQSVIGKKLDELRPIYEEWSTKVKSMDPKDPRALTFMNGATYYTYVYSDGSKGVHNFPYARLLLEKAELIWRGLQL